MTAKAPPQMPLWDSKRATCARFGIGLTSLDAIVDAGKVEARQMNPGRTSKVLIKQTGLRGMEGYIEALPVPNPPRLRRAKGGGQP